MDIDQDTEKLRHSAAHILAQAVLRLYPDTKLGIGPVTETGFYYDFSFSSSPQKSEADFIQELETECARIIEEELSFTQIYLRKEDALDMLYQQGQIFKTELVQELDTPEISFYRTGNEFIDLCRGPHVADTGKVGAIKLKQLTIAHWLGDESRPELLRISGLAFASKRELQEYIDVQNSIKTRRHEILGPELNIFNPQLTNGANNFVLLPAGLALKTLLIDKFKEVLTENDFEEYGLNNFFDKTELTIDEETAVAHLNLEEDFSVTEWPQATAGRILNSLGTNQGIYYVNNSFQTQTEKSEKHKSGLQLSAYYSNIKGHIKISSEEIQESIVAHFRTLLGLYKNLMPERYTAKLFVKDSKISNFLAEQIAALGISVNLKSVPEKILSLELSFLDVFEVEHVLFSFEIDPNFQTQALNGNSVGKNKKGKSEEVIVSFTFSRSIEALIAHLLEFYEGFLPSSISPVQVLLLAESPQQLPYIELIAENLKKQGVRASIYKSDFKQSLDINLIAAQKLRTPYIITATEHEEKNQIFSVYPATGESLGLMDESEFLQKSNLIS